MLFANDFATEDDTLMVDFISQRGIVRRSDAFLIRIGKNVLLLDAGLPEVPYALAKILELRAFFLIGHEELLEKKDVKIKLTWLASHMHIDHIGAFIYGISSSPYIYVEEAYLSPKTIYYDSELSKDWDGDYKYRGILKSRFDEFQSQCSIHDIPFSDTDVIQFEKAGAVFTLLPPVVDWGCPDLAALSKALYAESSSKDLPISITNSNSMWLLIEYKGVKFLFTGDSMKKTERGDESFDMMFDTWKKFFIHSDVVKYPHHGMVRDPAAASVASICPKYVVCNAIDTTAPAKMKALDLEIVKHIAFVCTGYEDGIFTVDKSGKLALEQR